MHPLCIASAYLRSPAVKSICSFMLGKLSIQLTPVLLAQPDVTVTLDTLHLVFSAFGLVQKIATFEKGQGFQALVQYSDPDTAEQVWPILSSKPPSAPDPASSA